MSASRFIRICLLLATGFVLSALAPATVAADDEVVCFGDSATAGAVDMSFPDYLEFFIDPGDGQVSNEGESGETAEEGVGRLFWLIISLQHYGAKVWTFWEGGNDLIDWVEETDPYLLNDPADSNYPYREELDAKLAYIADLIGGAVDLIRFAGAEAALGTYYDLMPWLPCDASPLGFLTPGLAEKGNHYQQELNDTIRQVAADKDAPVADIANLAVVNGHVLNYHNCNHMNAFGNFWVAAEWWITVLPYL